MEILTIDASLDNPSDSTEVNVTALVATVGTTDQLASGQKIKWTEDFLRTKAETFIGKPVNILLDSKGDATGHSRRTIGTIVAAYFDEVKKGIVVTAALWGHYYPETIQKMRDLYAQAKLKVSMELSYPKDTLVANSDGSSTPTVGTFSGMGFVGKPGDPRSMVYLMAALENDDKIQQEHHVNEVIKELIARLSGTYEESDKEQRDQDDINAELSAAHEGSFEWTARMVQEHLSAGKSPDTPTYHYMIATYSNYAIFQEGASYFRIDYKRSGDKLNFGEPQEVDPVYQPTAKASAEEGGDDPAENTGKTRKEVENDMTPEEAQAAQTAQIAELKAALDTANATLNDMKAADGAREADKKAETQANDRLAEIEKIVPVKDEHKTALHANLKSLDDASYEVLKAAFAASVEIAAGVAPGDKIENPDPTPDKDSQKVPEADMKKFQEEAQAQFGSGPQSEDKE